MCSNDRNEAMSGINRAPQVGGDVVLTRYFIAEVLDYDGEPDGPITASMLGAVQEVTAEVAALRADLSEAQSQLDTGRVQYAALGAERDALIALGRQTLRALEQACKAAVVERNLNLAPWWDFGVMRDRWREATSERGATDA